MNAPEFRPIEPTDVYGPSPEDKKSQDDFEKIEAEGGFSDDDVD